MIETPLQKFIREELRKLLEDLDAGNQPRNGALALRVSAFLRGQFEDNGT